MLKIVYARHNEMVQREFTYLQQGLLDSERGLLTTDANCRVIASDYELQQVRQQVTGIPMSSGDRVVWDGLFAIFILANLDLNKPVD